MATAHDLGDPVGTRADAEAAIQADPAAPAIIWDTPDPSPVGAGPIGGIGAGVGPSTNSGVDVLRLAPNVRLAPATFGSAQTSERRPRARPVLARIGRLATLFAAPSFLQLHGRSPMETSRIASTSLADAADALSRSPQVEWGHGRDAGQLRIGSFRTPAKELGRPRIADGTLHAPGVRRLRVTIAIYRYGQDRCSIQIRPRYRRPRTSRRLRHCLRSTHGCADRLRDIVLTVDFAPPRHDEHATAPFPI